MKGQLSAEMLILVAVIIAVVAIAATQLIGSAKKSGAQASQQADDILERTEKAMKGKTGDRCYEDDDCVSGTTCDCPTCSSKGDSYKCQ